MLISESISKVAYMYASLVAYFVASIAKYFGTLGYQSILLIELDNLLELLNKLQVLAEL